MVRVYFAWLISFLVTVNTNGPAGHTRPDSEDWRGAPMTPDGGYSGIPALVQFRNIYVKEMP